VTDADCLPGQHIACVPHFCECISEASAADSERDEVATVIDDPTTVYVRAGLTDDALAPALNVRDSSTTDGGCNWACFGTACECIPNDGGRSAQISKALVGLALVGAAAAGLF
jgi:hypothetical protein